MNGWCAKRMRGSKHWHRSTPQPPDVSEATGAIVVTDAILMDIPWEEMPSHLFYLDGVYTDVSSRNGVLIMAFTHVRARNIRVFTTRSFAAFDATTQAEKEAVQIALNLFPGEPVYTDCRDAAFVPGATLIQRSRNPAHMAARTRKNYRTRR